MFSRSLLRIRLRNCDFTHRINPYSIATQQPNSTQSRGWEPFGSRNALAHQVGEYDAAEIAMQKNMKLQYQRTLKKRKLVNPSVHLREGSNEEILQLEVEDLLRASNPNPDVDEADQKSEEPGKTFKPFNGKPPVELGTEIELDVVELSSTGDGLAYTPSKDHVVVIPFTVPGDRVLCKVYKWLVAYSLADFVKIITPSPKREGVTPNCRYFSECAGCQLQMIPYADQLAHKKSIVEKAFSKFSGLAPGKIPPIQDTMPSPLQYGYRTKLSPHFDGPGFKASSQYKSIPSMGFTRKGRREVMDIEHCPIGTDILQEGLKLERAKVAVNYKTYRRGKTVLLRESTTREPETNKPPNSNPTSPVAEFDTTTPPTSTTLTHLPDGRPQLTLTYPTHRDLKTYTSVETSMSTEYIGPHKFVNQAGSFFQNNNSILGPFTKYIHDNCIPQSSTPNARPIKYLLDAYCGSGLFTITLSSLFTSALGIDIDGRSIEAARQNAAHNSIPNAGFIEADATDLFADVPFPPDQTLVVIDPPRKGASEDFLRQLCMFRAKRVVYVSCNVHTQARDVGMIVQGFAQGCRYEIESLRGCDFFPQTGHVEGVCVLNRVDG